MADEGVPGGWGAKEGKGGGGRVIEPYVPPTYGYDSGTYTDPVTGKPISKKEAEERGIIDKPGEASAKIAAAGASPQQAYTPPPVGLEALKAAELQAAKQETLRRQSEIATTPGEALAIQRMLRSPTAQFASQEAAQRGYELASRYDRGFAPEQVRATLAPQYEPQAPTRYFYPAPASQAGIRPAFSTPAQSGSLAERSAFERRRASFYTYGTVRRLEAVSSRLQTGFESTIGYDERSSIPVKAIAGFGSAFTGLPAFAGQMAGAGEAIIRYPSASLRGLPTGFKILSKQVSEQARTKPIEFAGSIAGMATIGRYAPKVSVPKLTSEGFKAFTKSEVASLGRKADPWANIPTMRQSAQAAGRELTRKIEFGKTFQEPTGKGVAVTSGKQQLIAIQEQKQIPIMAPQKLSQVLQTKQVQQLKSVQVSPLKTVQELQTQQKTQLMLVPLTQLRTKTQLITPTRTKQITEQRTQLITKPITKLKVRTITSAIPATMTITKVQPVTRTVTKPVTVTRTQTQTVTKQITQQRTALKLETVQKKMPKTSSMFKRPSSMLRGSSKYTTKLGGKTLTQLQAELTGKKRKR